MTRANNAFLRNQVTRGKSNMRNSFGRQTDSGLLEEVKPMLLQSYPNLRREDRAREVTEPGCVIIGGGRGAAKTVLLLP